ncbi:MAG: 4Fe-4S binding protein [Candidatus Thorarchaeota archaeon]
MSEKDDELLSAFNKMMKDSGRIARRSPIFQKDIQDFEGIIKIQWKIKKVYGYQIFEKDNYVYKIGEQLEDPDLLVRISNPELAIRFFKGDNMGFSYAPRRDYKGRFKVDYVEGFKEVESEKGIRKQRISHRYLTAIAYNNKVQHPFNLLKLPPFQRGMNLISKKEEFGVYVPINLDIQYANKVIPYKVFEHFIEKASHIVLMDYCGCRRFNDCQHHDKSLGCLYMGDDTLQMKITKERGHFATKEEALERVRKAIDNGLIPLLGRAMGEAAGYGVEDKGCFLAACFCCDCCCINGKIMRFGPNANLTMFSRVEGVSVNVDEDLCEGCGKCVEVCVFRGRELIDGKAKIDQTRCLGCGRCAEVCPTGVTTIIIDDINRVDELIGKIEEYVDVTPQSTSDELH